MFHLYFMPVGPPLYLLMTVLQIKKNQVRNFLQQFWTNRNRTKTSAAQWVGLLDAVSVLVVIRIWLVKHVGKLLWSLHGHRFEFCTTTISLQIPQCQHDHYLHNQLKNRATQTIYHIPSGYQQQATHWWQIWTSTAIWSRSACSQKMSFPSPSGWWEFQLHPGQAKHHAQDLSLVSKETNARVTNIWKWRLQASKSQNLYLFFSVATPLLGHGQQLWAFKAVLGSRETPRLWATISPKEADLKA